ncbi:MAG: hypothetical protein D6677_13790 [Calditrichaeota bacterium]|nr:MAG: hypothetical protein D6677_13790 [Calditrichota bacterium]
MSIPALIITHGRLAEAMLHATGHFADISDAFRVYSNHHDDIETIVREGVKFLNESGDGSAFVFTDLVGGSCWQAGLRIRREFPGARVIGGVNLPMLISFAVNRNRLETDALLEKITEDAHKAIRVLS